MTYTKGTNEAGDTILIPTLFKNPILAAMDVIDGNDYFEAKKYQAELNYLFTFRYISGLTPDMTIQYQARTFLIKEIFNVQEKNEFHIVMATERVFKNG